MNQLLSFLLGATAGFVVSLVYFKVLMKRLSKKNEENIKEIQRVIDELTPAIMEKAFIVKRGDPRDKIL